MSALDAVLPALRCPVCGTDLRRDDQVRCASGHAFDLAKQGYLNLLGPTAKHHGDDAAMVAARERFLGAGHYAPLSAALAELARPGLVVDLAGGTGQHLAAVLDAAVASHGLVLEASTAALRRAARLHERIAAVGADAWAPLPLHDGAASTVLSVFGPRDPAELRRVVAADGLVVVAGPAPEHLAEIREPLGLITIAADRADRLDDAFTGWTTTVRHRIDLTLDLDRAQLADLVGMTPSARHVVDLADRLVALPERTELTAAFDLVAYAPV